MRRNHFAHRFRALGLQLICAVIVLAWAVTPTAAQQTLVTVLNPTGNAPPIDLKAMAERPQSLDGKTVYLVDVTFNGGELLLQQMEKWMTANLPKVKTVLRTKRGAYAADDPALWKEIKSVDGLMIMAIGH